jgi:hypothetical protein
MKAYFTRPFPPPNFEKSVGQGPIIIGSLNVLPAGSYVFFAKVIVRTLVDANGQDNARASFSLEAGGLKDSAHIALWHVQNPGAFQPEDTISLQLAATINGPSPKKDAEVKLFATAESGVLELKDLVLTAIGVDTIEDQESIFKPTSGPAANNSPGLAKPTLDPSKRSPGLGTG